MKSQMKTVVAIVGGFVVVGMGVLTVVVGGTEAHAKVLGGSGDTVTQTTPTTLASWSASPTVKAKPPSA
ncbi:hypothetical protein [Mycobacterium sp.]|jgi:hypothetical protein|uniref:hypothetical protein n=1 Tax=Mycobacterium sp. TaxID=1785 RepID=UPI003C75ADED